MPQTFMKLETKKLKDIGASTRKYSEFKKKSYELAKLPPEGKGLIDFTKRGRSFVIGSLNGEK